MLGRHVDLIFGVIEMQFHFCRGLVFSISLPPRYSLSLSLLLLISTSAAIAQVPSGSKVISRIEESSDWETCGNCGNTGGSGSLATFSMIRGIGTPNLDGSSTKFQVGGSHPFKNAYWYIKRYSSAPTTPLKYLKYEFYVYVPSGYGNAPQAIEFECQQKVGGYLYNFAWQANYASHSWRTYDFVKHEWQSSRNRFQRSEHRQVAPHRGGTPHFQPGSRTRCDHPRRDATCGEHPSRRKVVELRSLSY